MRARLLSLFENLKAPSERSAQKKILTHGGSKAAGKRKLKRPLATKKWTHLVLKSSKARGQYSMLKQSNSKWIEKLIETKAKKFSVEVKEPVNMGNHLHLRFRITSRHAFQNFLRSITSLIARHVTGARKGKIFGKFWDGLAFTRVLMTSCEERRLRVYFVANRIERQHGYLAREEFLKDVYQRSNCERSKISRLERSTQDQLINY